MEAKEDAVVEEHPDPKKRIICQSLSAIIHQIWKVRTKVRGISSYGERYMVWAR